MILRFGAALAALLVSLVAAPAPAFAQPFQFEMCKQGVQRGPGTTCIVDGDTLWLNGENIRLQDFDTPEPYTAACGGEAERRLASQASARLLELLNENSWTIERFGYDSTSSRRRLATIRIDGRDVGEILIEERLARGWPNGDEWWCR